MAESIVNDFPKVTGNFYDDIKRYRTNSKILNKLLYDILCMIGYSFILAIVAKKDYNIKNCIKECCLWKTIIKKVTMVQNF